MKGAQSGMEGGESEGMHKRGGGKGCLDGKMKGTQRMMDGGLPRVV